MRKTTRRAIFYGFLLAFLAATPFIILYSLGYIPDIKEGRLNLTGGFFVKTNETGVNIAVNGAIEKQTGFLSRGALVNDVPPGTIAVEVTKEGFYPWRKAIEIEGQLVQEFPYILLIPRNLNSSIIAGATTSLPLSLVPKALIPDPNGQKLFWATIERKAALLRLIDRESGKDVRSGVFLPAGENFESASWNGDGSEVLVGASGENSKRWYVIKADGGKPERLFDPAGTLFLTSSATSSIQVDQRLKLGAVKQVVWDISTANRFYLYNGENLYRWDRGARAARPVLQRIEAFTVTGDEIIFINQSGFIGRADLDGTITESLDRPGFFISEAQTPQIFKSTTGAIIVADSAGGLYYGEASAKKFKPVASNVSMIKFSPDEERLAYSNQDGELFMLLFADENRQPFRPKNTPYQLIDAAVPIGNLIWFNKKSTHIVFTTKNGIFITETDNRFGTNTTTLKTGQFLIAAVPNDPNSFYFTDGEAIQEMTIK
ncbi:MAG: hypothetical protein HYT40_02350 [Candidatus Sungbacteria bacterium]|uniref:PEGA domain-containing protein n=1 Tax=Candidatus Sungiibacteriota bacterium TaxID=2750080 RepID=A0A931SE14_9BACT|nr:hypothetical protein [Candidatus Sungbacteria bacterium]